MRFVVSGLAFVAVVACSSKEEEPVAASPTAETTTDVATSAETAAAVDAPVEATSDAPIAPQPTRYTFEVLRDPRGIAHIYAKGRPALAFGQGYETTRDRLFHLEYLRRFAYGTRAEAFGEAFAADDQTKRGLGLRRIAEKVVARTQEKHPEIHAILVAYSAGVNAALADMKTGKNGMARPHDLDRFGKDWWPAPWTPVDSMALGKALVVTQNFLGDVELLILALKTVIGVEKFAGIFRFQPVYPTYIMEDTVTPPFAEKPGAMPWPALPSERDPVAHLTAAQRAVAGPAMVALAKALADAVGHEELGSGGSNSWAVRGDHTASGGAILCNDPHLPMDLPSRMYAIHLIDTGDPSKDNVGAFGHSLAGTPLLTFGNTRDLAWGITNSFVDTTDLFQETVSEDKKSVKWNGKDVPIELHEEVIAIRPDGGSIADAATNPKNRKATLRWIPHHGPLLNDLVPAAVAAVLEGLGLTFSAAWPGFGTDTDELVAINDLLDAKNVEEGLTALSHFNGGTVNWTLADAAGHVAYVAAGGWPQRAKPSSEQAPYDPLPGTGESDWKGMLPYEQVPQLIDPKKGFVVTANNQQLPNNNDNEPANDAKYIGHFSDLGTRAWRITDRLAKMLETAKPKGAPIDLEMMRVLLADDRAVVADVLLPHVLALKAKCGDPGGDVCQAITALEDWDRGQGEESVGAAIFGTWIAHYVVRTYGDDIGTTLLPLVGNYVTAFAIKSTWAWLRKGYVGKTYYDDAKTKDVVETFDDMALGALADAMAHLKQKYGQTPMAQWRWGDLHQVRFTHPAWDDLSHGPIPRSGGMRTVNAADYKVFAPDGKPAEFPYLMTEGSVFRYCVELSPKDGPSGHQSLAGGQSSDSKSVHFTSQVDDWRKSQAQAIRFRRGEVEKDAVTTRVVEVDVP